MECGHGPHPPKKKKNHHPHIFNFHNTITVRLMLSEQVVGRTQKI